MDNKALAETYVDLWIYVDKEFKNKTNEDYGETVVNMVFEQTCKRIISDLIGKQRQGVPTQQKQSSDEKPTEKQIAFAKKLGHTNPEQSSKKTLSAWIEENKTY